jgi:hypothetical protein
MAKILPHEQGKSSSVPLTQTIHSVFPNLFFLSPARVDFKTEVLTCLRDGVVGPDDRRALKEMFDVVQVAKDCRANKKNIEETYARMCGIYKAWRKDLKTMPILHTIDAEAFRAVFHSDEEYEEQVPDFLDDDDDDDHSNGELVDHSLMANRTLNLLKAVHASSVEGWQKMDALVDTISQLTKNIAKLTNEAEQIMTDGMTDGTTGSGSDYTEETVKEYDGIRGSSIYIFQILQVLLFTSVGLAAIWLGGKYFKKPPTMGMIPSEECICNHN